MRTPGDLAYEEAGRQNHTFATQQLTWMTVGVALFVATLVLLRDHRVLTRFTYTSGLGAIVLLLLPMVPGVGKTVNGAKIWIGVGPFSFQPGEVAKVLLVVAFAGYLVLHRDALALAGRPGEAVQLLDVAARAEGADSRVRQNLALANALAGDWMAARGINCSVSAEST